MPSATGRFIVVALVLLLAGCSPRRKFEDYIPPDDQARQALEACLKAWQEGRPPGQVADGPPAVYLVDGHRRPNQELRSYEVLGPAPGNAPRCYAVRVVLATPPAEQRLRFVVVGIDPLWVLRHEDYEMILHWEHPMPAEDTKKETKASPSR